METSNKQTSMYWEPIVNEFKKLNVSAASFCRERSLCYANFKYWHIRIRGHGFGKPGVQAKPSVQKKLKSPFLAVQIKDELSTNPQFLNESKFTHKARPLPESKWIAEVLVHICEVLR